MNTFTWRWEPGRDGSVLGLCGQKAAHRGLEVSDLREAEREGRWLPRRTGGWPWAPRPQAAMGLDQPFLPQGAHACGGDRPGLEMARETG